MDLTTIAVSTVLTVAVMLLIYHCWIIPKVVDGIKTELPPTILAIVDEKFNALMQTIADTISGKLAEVKENVAETIEEKSLKIAQSIGGKKGSATRLANMAAAFLQKNGVTDDTLNEVIARYGEEALQKIAEKSKPAAADNGTGVNW